MYRKTNALSVKQVSTLKKGSSSKHLLPLLVFNLKLLLRRKRKEPAFLVSSVRLLIKQ